MKAAETSNPSESAPLPLVPEAAVKDPATTAAAKATANNDAPASMRVDVT